MALPYVPKTPIVSLYEALKKSTKEGGPGIAERLAICREYADEPQWLAHDFSTSVDLMEQFVPRRSPSTT